MIIRPVALSDLPALQAIAVESGPGFMSLVDDQDFLTRKIERSIASFASDVRQPGDQSYLFVLVDPQTGGVMGTTGIEASIGAKRPLYHFRVGDSAPQSDPQRLSLHHQTLTLCTHYSGCSEICTLFLRPRYRRPWAGKLLSRVRFLFMAQHPQRFANKVIAEMRGVSDASSHSPFWQWLQGHFIGLDFATVSRMVGTGNNSFIGDLMPTHPLDTHLMSPEARAVIGQVHPDTAPALHMLTTEGFRFNGLIDPFDGGPRVEARVADLRSATKSRRCRVHIRPDLGPASGPWTNGGQGKTLMVTNTGTTDFRAIVTHAARYLPAQDKLELPGALAESLNLSSQAEVCFADLSANSSKSQGASIAKPCQTGSINLFEEAFRAY